MDQPERFVDADAVAEFLGITRRQVLAKVRAGELPAIPISGKKRHVWKFLISEVSSQMISNGGKLDLAARLDVTPRRKA